MASLRFSFRASSLVVLVFGVGLTSGAALAGQVPVPKTDYEGVWKMDSGETMEFHYSAARHAMRMNMQSPDGKSYMVKDMGSGVTHMWSDEMPGMVMRMKGQAISDAPEAVKLDETKEIAGEICTVWAVKDGGHTCFTDDGIWLENTMNGAHVEVQSLARRTQDAALFEPPAGAQIMEMPGGGAGGRAPFALQ